MLSIIAIHYHCNWKCKHDDTKYYGFSNILNISICSSVRLQWSELYILYIWYTGPPGTHELENIIFKYFQVLYVLQDVKNELMTCTFFIFVVIYVFWIFARHCLESYGSNLKFIVLCHWAKCSLRGEHFSHFWGENSSLCSWEHNRYLYLEKGKGIALH